ncbi:hypothetical protein [Bradyrhizobium cytisi]|uniref:Uncharacterized protein n=1 Tax=Bradyrhizobium cytisi TaxID=515489 RepID=A0A5S4W1M2_9BRAD|nr:hypothetical protein [Bradyrhizobium cytisi]TYL75309.1 hypothetical protein FXB38_33185 [Bradyrhizobium cytisi]
MTTSVAAMVTDYDDIPIGNIVKAVTTNGTGAFAFGIPPGVSLWSSPFQIVMLLGRIGRLRAVALAWLATKDPARTLLDHDRVPNLAIDQPRIGSHQLRVPTPAFGSTAIP